MLVSLEIYLYRLPDVSKEMLRQDSSRDQRTAEYMQDDGDILNCVSHRQLEFQTCLSYTRDSTDAAPGCFHRSNGSDFQRFQSDICSYTASVQESDNDVTHERANSCVSHNLSLLCGWRRVCARIKTPRKRVPFLARIRLHVVPD